MTLTCYLPHATVREMATNLRGYRETPHKVIDHESRGLYLESYVGRESAPKSGQAFFGNKAKLTLMARLVELWIRVRRSFLGIILLIRGHWLGSRGVRFVSDVAF